MNTQTLRLDTSKAQAASRQVVTLRQGDQNGTTLVCYITNHSQAFDLTGLDATLVMRAPGGEAYSEFEGAVDGNVATFLVDETYAAAVLGASDVNYVRIDDDDGTIASTSSFTVIVVAEGTDGVTPPEPTINVIDQLITELEDGIEAATEATSAANAAAEAAQEAADSISDLILTEWSEVSSLVSRGLGEKYFPVGSLVSVPWSDPRTSVTKEWDYIWHVVHHGTVTLKSGETVLGMFMQSAYTLPFATQFDAYEGFYCVPSGGLSAGTYYVTFGNTSAWGKVTANEVVHFTLSSSYSAGALLRFSGSVYSTDPASLKVAAYANASAIASGTATEMVSCASGQSGTSLGTVNAVSSAASTWDADADDLNHLNRIGLGNNRFEESGIVQFLNSKAAAGSWWSAKNKWDVPPSYLATTAGFLSGFSDDFVNAMGEIQVKTALAYIDGGTSQGTECDTAYHKVFLPAAEQLNWVCTWLGVPYGLEGEAWDYWVRAYGTTPANMNATHAEFCMSDLDTKSTMRYVFERSAHRSNGYYVAYCTASGLLNGASATNGHFVAPACCIV